MKTHSQAAQGCLGWSCLSCLSVCCSGLHQLRTPAMLLWVYKALHGVWLLCKIVGLVQFWFGYCSSIAKVYMQTSCSLLTVWLWSPTCFTNAYSTDCLTKLLFGAEADDLLLTVWADCLHTTVRMCVATVCTSPPACLALQV